LPNTKKLLKTGGMDHWIGIILQPNKPQSNTSIVANI
jgi:hypothetical protein